MRTPVTILVAFALAALVASCGEKGSSTPDQKEWVPDDVARGTDTFAEDTVEPAAEPEAVSDAEPTEDRVHEPDTSDKPDTPE